MKSEYQGVVGIHHSKGRRTSCSCEECFARVQKRMKDIMNQENEITQQKKTKI